MTVVYRQVPAAYLDRPVVVLMNRALHDSHILQLQREAPEQTARVECRGRPWRGTPLVRHIRLCELVFDPERLPEDPAFVHDIAAIYRSGQVRLRLSRRSRADDPLALLALVPREHYVQIVATHIVRPFIRAVRRDEVEPVSQAG